jgi:hypothetical protein
MCKNVVGRTAHRAAKNKKKTRLQNVYFGEEQIRLTTEDMNIITDY